MKTPKRPRDPAQLAKLIVDIVTGEVVDEKPVQPADTVSKSRARSGGIGRAASMSPDRRKAIAKNAAKVRWGEPSDA